MAKALPPEMIALNTYYAIAQHRMIQKIAMAQAKGNSLVYLNNVMKNIQGEIAALDDFSAKWAKSTVSKNYMAVAKKTYAASRKEFVELSYGNQAAMNILIENASGSLLAANHAVGSSLGDIIRQSNIDAITISTVMGNTMPETKKNVMNHLFAKGITSVKDKNGKPMRLTSYCEMVARSTYTEANNIATTETMLELGNDLVQMTHHSTSCPICAPLEGRVYSITGKTKGYPQLEQAYTGGYANIHPNCGHTLTPYFPQYDVNAAATKEYSTAPFKPDSEAATAYKAQQHKKAVTNTNRKQWEALKASLGEGKAPKTLAGYTKMKSTNSPAFKLLTANYKAPSKIQQAPTTAMFTGKQYTADEMKAQLHGMEKVKFIEDNPSLMANPPTHDQMMGMGHAELNSFIDEAFVTLGKGKLPAPKPAPWKPTMPIVAKKVLAKEITLDTGMVYTEGDVLSKPNQFKEVFLSHLNTGQQHEFLKGFSILDTHTTEELDDLIHQAFKQSFAKPIAAVSKIQKLTVNDVDYNEKEVLSKHLSDKEMFLHKLKIQDKPDFLKGYDYFMTHDSSELDALIHKAFIIKQAPQNIQKVVTKTTAEAPIGKKATTFKKEEWDKAIRDNEGNEDYFVQQHQKWAGAIKDAEVASIKHYTGSGYVVINSKLRDGEVGLLSTTDKKHLLNLKQALRAAPLEDALYVRRGSTTNSLWGLVQEKYTVGGTADVTQWVGKTVTDKGFLSCTPFEKGGFQGGVEYKIYCPKGTKGAYVDPISEHRGERELILQAGTKFTIDFIETIAYNKYEVYMSVIV